MSIIDYVAIRIYASDFEVANLHVYNVCTWSLYVINSLKMFLSAED
jgi:hypothetical protein